MNGLILELQEFIKDVESGKIEIISQKIERGFQMVNLDGVSLTPIPGKIKTITFSYVENWRTNEDR